MMFNLILVRSEAEQLRADASMKCKYEQGANGVLAALVTDGNIFWMNYRLQLDHGFASSKTELEHGDSLLSCRIIMTAMYS